MALKHFLGAAVLAATGLGSGTAQAVNVDLTFVIDRSGSMSDEYRDLQENLGVVFDGLSGAAGIDSVQAGLISYGGRHARQIRLEQDITGDVDQLKSAFGGVETRGGVENALRAVDAAIPGSGENAGATYRDDTVRSIVLITDENADDRDTYSYGGQSGYAALGQYVEDSGYLLNIVTKTKLFDEYSPAARPGGNPGNLYPALFDIAAFNDDPEAFLSQLATTKSEEVAAVAPPALGKLPVTQGGSVTVVPLPASAFLLGGVLLGLGGAAAWRGRGQHAEISE